MFYFYTKIGQEQSFTRICKIHHSIKRNEDEQAGSATLELKINEGDMKRLFFCVICLFAICNIKAQDMASLFVAMPDALVPQLEDAWRKDLIDLYNTGKEAKLKNTMNGFSTLRQVTPDYLLLQVSENSKIELKLFPLVNNTQIIGMITTVNGPVPDSRISFYTTAWESLDTADLFTPVSSGWFIKDGIDKNGEAFKNAVSVLDMDLVEYHFSPDDLTLTATYATPLYLSKKDRERVLPYLKENPKVYSWQKFHFK